MACLFKFNKNFFLNEATSEEMLDVKNVFKSDFA